MARSLAALLLLLVAAMAASAEYQDDSVGTHFFLNKDLYPGSKMTLHFTRTQPAAGTTATAALARAYADSVPFTSAKILEILSARFSIADGSPATADVRAALAACEAAPAPGVEALRCVTSTEAMLGLAAAILGTRDVRAAATRLGAAGATTPRQAYVVRSVAPLPVAGGDMVACHRAPYPYAVFACHATTAAVYAVALAGEDGTKGEALAACHADAFPGITGEAFEKLGVKPGSAPLCHFLPEDSMLWMRN